MICVIKYPADVIFQAVRAFFVFEHFPICTWSVADYQCQSKYIIPEALCINFLKMFCILTFLSQF